MIQKAACFPIGTIRKINGKKKIVKLVQTKGKQPYHKWVNMTKDIIKVDYNVKYAINLFLRSRNLLNNAFSNFILVMGYYYMSDLEVIPQPVQTHRHRSRRSKPKIENKLVKKSNGLGLGFLSIGSIVGLVVLGLFMMNEICILKNLIKVLYKLRQT